MKMEHRLFYSSLRWCWRAYVVLGKRYLFFSSHHSVASFQADWDIILFRMCMKDIYLWLVNTVVSGLTGESYPGTGISPERSEAPSRFWKNDTALRVRTAAQDWGALTILSPLSETWLVYILSLFLCLDWDPKKGPVVIHLGTSRPR